MTVKEFKELVEELQIPDSAEIFVQADHGQHIESAYYGIVTRADLEDVYDLEDVIWESKNWQDGYGEDVVAEYNQEGEIRGVLIGSY